MSLPSSYHILSTPDQLPSLLNTDLSRLSLLYFRADWAEPCTKKPTTNDDDDDDGGGGMDYVVRKLAREESEKLISEGRDVGKEGTLWLEIEAETLPEVSESFDVESVPYCVILRGHTLLARIPGSQPKQLASQLALHSSSSSSFTSRTAATSTIHQPLSKTDQKPEAPTPLSKSNIKNGTNGDIDITTTPPPTSTQSETKLESPPTSQDLTTRCQTLMSSFPVMLFMKGNPNQPRCGFSQKIVGILKEEGIEFGHFDILTDEGVRSELKSINSWPTFPQLIIKGEFVGGLDIVEEMAESGELSEVING